MFKKFVAEMVAAKTREEVMNILYRVDGVDMSYQKEKISWKDHELLFNLADAFKGNGRRGKLIWKRKQDI